MVSDFARTVLTACLGRPTLAEAMCAVRRVLFVALLLTGTATSVAAKGPTSKITITAPDLSEPITISDPTTLEPFQIWSGATDAAYDCVTEIGFDDLGGMRLWSRWYLGDDGRVLRDDEDNFMDTSQRVVIVTQARDLTV